MSPSSTLDAARHRLDRQAIDDNARLPGHAAEVRRDGELTAVHGWPRDPTWEYITGPDVASANLSSFDTRICPRIARTFRSCSAPGEPWRRFRHARGAVTIREGLCSTQAASASRVTAIRPRRTR
jgi:hypothetical protein